MDIKLFQRYVDNFENMFQELSMKSIPATKALLALSRIAFGESRLIIWLKILKSGQILPYSL